MLRKVLKYRVKNKLYISDFLVRTTHQYEFRLIFRTLHLFSDKEAYTKPRKS